MQMLTRRRANSWCRVDTIRPQRGAPMPTYSLDTFHPTHLRCDQCGHGLPASPPAEADPEELRTLTEEEAVLVWPALAADLHLHDYVCPGACFGIPQEEWEAMATPR